MANTKEVSIIREEFIAGENELNFDEISNESKDLFKWKCSDCNETWETSKFQRIIAKKGNCHYCTGQKVRPGESISDLYPELISEWSEKNNRKIIEFSIKNRDYKAIWNCKTCNTEYERRIFSRVKGNGCKCKKSLNITHPELANELIDADASKITKGSKAIHQWKCSKCNHIWEKSVLERTANKSKCEKCSGKVAMVGTCLADTQRDLMLEWDFEKNSISPFSITSKNYSTLIHWKCKEHPEYHKWEKELGQRLGTKPTNCPYCYGTGKTSILESILTTEPELAKEWDYAKNTLNIENIRKSSSRKINWLCKNCNHSWQATPANRSGLNETGCPECSAKESKVENHLREELKKVFSDINENSERTSFNFSSKMPITVDFIIREINFAFDLDPYHTHKKRLKIDTEKSLILKNYCNFFKVREHPLEAISNEDLIYYYAINKNTVKLLAKSILEKILKMFPDLNNNLRGKIEDYLKQ